MKLIVLTVISFTSVPIATPLAPVNAEEAIATVRIPRYGTFDIPAGCKHQRLDGTDSFPGRLTCRGGDLVIDYDIGKLAGDHCATAAAPVTLRGRDKTVVSVCVSDPSRFGDPDHLVATIPANRANFFVRIHQPGDVVIFLRVILSYRAGNR